MLRWGLIGAGRAGRARADAIDADPRATLVGWHRGHLDHPTARPFNAVAPLFDAVDAVAICSPNGAHEAQAQAALEAGRHVVCEFPLALSADGARHLFALARSSERSLHVAHIELLTPTSEWLRARVRGRRLLTGRLLFTSPGGGWLEDEAAAGSLAHRNVARLHRLLDLFGPPTERRLLGRSAGHLDASLAYGDALIGLSFRQARGLPRSSDLELTLSDGLVSVMGRTVLDRGRQVVIPDSRGLFLTDQLLASAQLLDGFPAPVCEERILTVLDLADHLASADPTH